MIDLVKEIEDNQMLYQLWDKYQLKAYVLRKKAKVLQKKVDNLAFNDKTSSIVNSDNKDNFSSQLYIFGQFTLAITNRLTHLLKLQTPVSMAKTIVQLGKNKKYPDISFFYGNGDDKEK